MKRRTNGAGSISQLKDSNRSKQWIVRVSEDGTTKKKYVGSFETYDDAEYALSMYKRNPHDTKKGYFSLAEVYEMYRTSVLCIKAKETQDNYQYSFNRLKDFYNLNIEKLEHDKLQKFINTLDTYGAKSDTRKLLIAVEDYSKTCGVIPLGISKLLEIGEKPASTAKNIFTSDEIKTLWDNKDMPYADIALILIYSGMRISEIDSIYQINMKERYMVGGTKTRAGKNRIIPVRNEAVELIEKRLSDSGVLTGGIQKKSLGVAFNKVMDKLNMKHTSHECRHTFTTCAIRSGIEVASIDKLTGHVSNNTSLDVYTHLTPQEIVDIADRIVFID